jgi:hypothetical protein
MYPRGAKKQKRGQKGNSYEIELEFILLICCVNGILNKYEMTARLC